MSDDVSTKDENERLIESYLTSEDEMGSSPPPPIKEELENNRTLTNVEQPIAEGGIKEVTPTKLNMTGDVLEDARNLALKYEPIRIEHKNEVYSIRKQFKSLFDGKEYDHTLDEYNPVATTNFNDLRVLLEKVIIAHEAHEAFYSRIKCEFGIDNDAIEDMKKNKTYTAGVKIENEESCPIYMLFIGNRLKYNPGFRSISYLYRSLKKEITNYMNRVKELVRLHSKPDAPFVNCVFKDSTEHVCTLNIAYEIGGFSVIAAGAGVGKTTLMLNHAVELAIKGVQTCYMSLENSQESLYKSVFFIHETLNGLTASGSFETNLIPTASILRNRLEYIGLDLDNNKNIKKKFNTLSDNVELLPHRLDKNLNDCGKYHSKFQQKKYIDAFRLYILKRAQLTLIGNSNAIKELVRSHYTSGTTSLYERLVYQKSGNCNVFKLEDENIVDNFLRFISNTDPENPSKLTLAYYQNTVSNNVLNQIATKADDGVKVFFIDYVGRVQSPDPQSQKSYNYELKDFAIELNRLAIEKNITLVLGVQTNRDSQNRSTDINDTPSIGCLADSADIAREAHNIYVITQVEKGSYNGDNDCNWNTQSTNIPKSEHRVVHCIKKRHGYKGSPQGFVFDKHTRTVISEGYDKIGNRIRGVKVSPPDEITPIMGNKKIKKGAKK
jgi:hypothetical protein